jgi:hypothetical protein
MQVNPNGVKLTLNLQRITVVFILCFLFIGMGWVQHVDAIPTSHMLSVPYHSQINDYYCDPAVVQMALQYISGKLVSQDILAAEIGTTPDNTPLENMTVPFYLRGFSNVQITHSNLSELKTLNANGFLSIILIYFDITDHDPDDTHFVLVVGYNESGIFVHDPWPPAWGEPDSRDSGPYAFIPNDQLNDIWSYDQQWTLEIPYSSLVMPELPESLLTLLLTLALATLVLSRRTHTRNVAIKTQAL